MAAVAVIAAVFGADRMWRRSLHFQRQAALCAYCEACSLGYALGFEKDTSGALSDEDRRESALGNRREAEQSRLLKVAYQRVASHPWEGLPPGVPDSVNPWDLGDLSASELEEEAKAMMEAYERGEPGLQMLNFGDE